MRPARVFATTVAATALVGLAAPAAMASVDPHRARPGQTVRITDDKKCDSRRGATAYSAAFGTTRLQPSGRQLAGTARVLRDAKGKNKVILRCGDGRKFFDWLTVGPTGGSRAGEGGTGQGLGNPEFVGGAALVALAAGGSAIVIRRRVKGQS
ncbi:hypothetical protein ABT112_10750 [Streptomyces sp. NPDC002055]|uniref:hypothetical protein n=1 Tax=Streptomyces sp. NPDC002055 TaxID=3154534 RepID=UPI00332697C1